MTPRRYIAVGISGHRIRAVEARSAGDGLEVVRAMTGIVPESIDPDDAPAFGRAISDLLREAGISRGRAILAVPRESVSLKRLTLPAADRYDLPGMVRLAMQRDLPFDPSDAVIDYIVISQSATQVSVLVAAMQRRLLDHLIAVAKAAKLRVDRVSLRCMGLSMLLRTGERVTDEQNAVLGLDLTGDAAEIVFIANGSIRFSRAARITPSDDVDVLVDAVVTEVRRSWMSYRMTEEAPEIAGGIILGPGELASECATAIGDLLKVRADVLDRHPRIDVDEPEIETVWPLAGLLLEKHIESDAIDFAQPTQAPDRGARRRVFAYAAAAVLFIAFAMLGMIAMKNLRDLRTQADELRARVNEESVGHYRYERELRRLQHLDRWQQTHVDWLAHLAAIGERLPDNEYIVLDSLQGTLRNALIGYDARQSQWNLSREIIFSIEGEAVSQGVVDDVRRVLAADRRYVVQPAGQDAAGGRRYPNPFKLTLRTTLARPEVEQPPAAGDDESEARSTRSGAAATSRRAGRSRP